MANETDSAMATIKKWLENEGAVSLQELEALRKMLEQVYTDTVPGTLQEKLAWGASMISDKAYYCAKYTAMGMPTEAAEMRDYAVEDMAHYDKLRGAA